MAADNSVFAAESSGERERAGPKGYLPKLWPEYYRGRVIVHWTLTIEQRQTGWVSMEFMAEWGRVLLHTCARYDICTPIYVLMPDHIHMLIVGLSDSSDQRTAIEFLRKHTAQALTPATWQKQAHDHVLRDQERERGAVESIAHYILENPVRRQLTTDWRQYEFVGCCVPGYPDLDPRASEYWGLFWRIYHRLVEKSARSRSPLQ